MLCEECGYPLKGLDQEGACPECGRPITQSLPENRPGSAWQRAPGFFSWVRTNWAVLRLPKQEFSRIRIEPRSGTGLLILNTLLTAALFIDPWVGVVVKDPARAARHEGGVQGWAIVAGMWILETVFAAAVLWLLTWVEFLGIRFFSRRRGWRLTPEGAWQVCCHASVGWLMLGILPVLTLAAFQALVRLFHVGPPRGGLLRGWGAFSGMSWSDLIYGAGLFCAVMAGMMTFEILVYVGVRRCRYAATKPPQPLIPPVAAPVPR